MSEIIRGDRLNPTTRAEVLSAYPYRNTVENRARNPEYVAATGSTLPPCTDVEWLAAQAFRVRRDGHLDRRCRFALPACMADDDE